LVDVSCRRRIAARGIRITAGATSFTNLLTGNLTSTISVDCPRPRGSIRRPLSPVAAHAAPRAAGPWKGHLAGTRVYFPAAAEDAGACLSDKGRKHRRRTPL